LGEVADAQGLTQRLEQLWREPSAAQAMRAAGLAVMQANQGALARLLAGLARLLG
ncbi:MAG: 3-deoxy-D-manno-octulosonic acid transferase, partial [Pseudomonas sp.]|nr:3-deoxy-D-manno-octulosonic acid transferase [Pseudomonas sp.]